jgi:hypothetical protein
LQPVSPPDTLARRGLSETLVTRLNANKMKGNENRIAFISFHFFFRIGPFQRVTADSNKKSFSLSDFCDTSPYNSPVLASPDSLRARITGREKTIAQIPIYEKKRM